MTVLTGAGISAESGVPTFRGPDGLWEGRRVEEVATPEGFAADPPGVWAWYNERRVGLQNLKPNAGHVALASLARAMSARGGWLCLATQNIDGLHQAAGSEGVLELHGSLTWMKCTACDYRQYIGLEPVKPVPACPSCGRQMRPDIVWFGETLPQEVWLKAYEAASGCDVFLTVGTSAVVYPAASLIHYARQGGAAAIEVNLDPTPASGLVDVALHGKAGEILPQLVG